MNKDLQFILNFIQQSDHLSAEEKTTLSKAAKAADKELEITAFKLGRTEKVKHTTAILLEETIEELEQKRKAVEAQNRELEIETSLERVRTIAMGMRKADDLLDICEILFTELLHMGFSELRNAMINIYNDEKSSFLNYDYSVNAGKTVTIMPYNFHPLIEKQVRITREKNDAFYEFSFTGNELKDFRELRKNNGEQDDPKLDDTTSLHYYFYSIGTGSISISTYNAISEEKKNVLKRFRNVFDLAYKRYMDITNAEAQAREAQVQLALERVRARTMAMQKSGELTETAGLIFQQINELGIQQWGNAFQLFDDDMQSVTSWTCTKGREIQIFKIPATVDPIMINIAKAAQKGEKLYVEQMGGVALENHYKYMTSLPIIKEVFEQLADAGFTPPKFQVFHAAYFSNGYILFITHDPCPEAHDIFKRFTKVFEQTYTRFLDLQKAEAQAREAKIEAALERVRSRSMAMYKSEELSDVITVVSDQLQQLKVRFDHVSFVINSDAEDYHFWTALYGKPRPYELKVPYLDNPIANSAKKARSQGLKFYQDTLTPEENRAWLEHAFKNNPTDFFSPDEKAYAMNRGFSRSIGIMPNIMLAVGNYASKLYSNEDNQIIKRFAAVFEQSYTRFLDLQKAEAQAREAKIEAALERVRSRSIAMRKSEEIADIAGKIFSELSQLDLALNRVLIWTFNDIEKYTTWWSSNPEVESTAESYRIDYNENPVFINYLQAWQQRKPIHLYFLEGDTKETWSDFLFEHTELSRLPAAVRKNMREEGDLFTISVISDYGLMMTGSLKPLSDANIDIIQRFGRVFQQSYTRYLDVQKAEAQAREAQIEAALEKVRSRTLAMQKSEELAETSAVLFQQLIHLGIEPNRLYIGIIEDNSSDMEFWITDEDGSKVSTMFKGSAAKNASMKKMYDGWKQHKNSIVIDMEGKELEDYFHYLGEELHIPFKGGLSQKRRWQYIAYFSKGLIGMASPDEQPEETLHLLERFAAVFNLTFTRFNDLKIAEAHALQAEQDLIEIKAARKKAEETLTELQATQKQLIQSEKMASLGELTAGIAHEIQNPLNFVNNFSEINKELIDEMQQEIDKGNYTDAIEISNDIKANEEKINHHGKRADAIVKGMLQHSRSSNGVKEPTNINALADEYLRLAYHGLRAKDKTFNASMKTDFDESIGNINIITQDIGRVILNLITNAFYVVDEKKKSGIENYEPTVSVSTKSIKSPSGDLGVVLTVKDNGNGIPQKVLDKIFQPFFTTKPTGQGTGLGLSLSYDIIKAHGGEINVETKENEGSEFIINLPA